MPTSKLINEITLFPVNTNGVKRSHDDVSDSPPPEDNKLNVYGHAARVTNAPPQDVQDRMPAASHDSPIGGETARFQHIPHRTSEMLRAHFDRKSVTPDDGGRRASMPVLGAARRVEGPIDERQALPSLREAITHTWHAVPSARAPEDKNASILSLRAQIIDNIHVLGHYIINPQFQQVLNASRHNEDTGSIHIVTLKSGGVWTAVWMYGFNHVILRSAGAPSAVEALENMLQCTSEILLGNLTASGKLAYMGP